MVLQLSRLEPPGGGAVTVYDREVLVQVITYHRNVTIEGCMCGWADLGKDHSKHVADVYEQSVAAR